jgi:creatinine amidohydrolase
MGLISLETATWEDVDSLSRTETVLLLPTGAIEQHGRHLPLNTDSAIVLEVAKRSAERACELNPGLTILLLPLLNVGRSSHHLDFPGSLSLSASTYIRAVEEIILCLHRHGFKRALLLNGHGGNTDCLHVAARNIRDQADMLVAVAPYWQIGKDSIVEIRDSAAGGICHAGEMETSCMYHLCANSVRTANIKHCVVRPRSSRMVFDLIEEGIRVNHNVADISKTGAVGDPTVATREKGALFLTRICEEVAIFLADFQTWSIENLASRQSHAR